MANKKLWLGILVMVLVFGMAVIGCDNDNGGGGDDDDSTDASFLDTLNLNTSDPTSLGINLAMYNQIRDAGSGGFQGWAIDKVSDLFY